MPLEGQRAAGGHGGGPHAPAARLRRDVDPLDLRTAVAGTADVHLEQQLAADLVDVGRAARGEDLDPPAVPRRVAGQRVLPHLLGVHGGGQVQHPLLVGWGRQPRQAAPRRRCLHGLGIDRVDELAVADLPGGAVGRADQLPEPHDRQTLADQHPGRRRARRGGRQRLAGGDEAVPGRLPVQEGQGRLLVGATEQADLQAGRPACPAPRSRQTHPQRRVTSGLPLAAPEALYSSASSLASCISESTISDSGTVRITWPPRKIWPLPLPEATPMSASRASPGPLTMQPITATRSGASISPIRSSTALARLNTSTSARPQDGQATRSSFLGRRPRAPRIALPTLTSSTGWAVSDTRMVSPMPSASSAPMPTVDLMMPSLGVPASVTPRWSG